MSRSRQVFFSDLDTSPDPKKQKIDKQKSPSTSEVTDDNVSPLKRQQPEVPEYDATTPKSDRQGGLLSASRGNHGHERGKGAITLWNNKDRAVIKVNVTSNKNDGKYVLEITKEEGPSDEVNRADQMVESAAKLLHHAEILRGMGEQLREIFQPSLQSIFGKSILEL